MSLQVFNDTLPPIFQQVSTAGEAKIRSARDQRNGTAILAFGHQVRSETRAAPQRCQSGAHSSGQATVIVVVVVVFVVDNGVVGAARRQPRDRAKTRTDTVSSTATTSATPA